VTRHKRLLAAAAIDALIGDPPSLPHPVRAIGASIARGEPIVRALFPRTAAGERAGGAALAATVVACTAILAVRARRCGMLLEAVAASSALALRSLYDEVDAVARALESNDLERARQRLARIVGRDTENLDASAVARAAIETLAESTCDGVIAPALYLVLGGVGLAYAYKAINTLDSMIGHPEPPYTNFGWFAARLDDVANYLPARLSACCIVIAAGLLESNSKPARTTWRRDAGAHRSPNAGQTEAAMAGALRVRLGGTNSYAGVSTPGATFGGEFSNPQTADVRRAMRITVVASIAGYALTWALAKAIDARV
jgi:adenosylcobinamide-phosphate synthase